MQIEEIESAQGEKQHMNKRTSVMFGEKRTSNNLLHLLIDFSIGDKPLLGPEGVLITPQNDDRTILKLMWPVESWAFGPRESEWFSKPARIWIARNPDIDSSQYHKFIQTIRTEVEKCRKVVDLRSTLVDIEKVARKAREKFLLPKR